MRVPTSIKKTVKAPLKAAPATPRGKPALSVVKTGRSKPAAEAAPKIGAFGRVIDPNAPKKKVVKRAPKKKFVFKTRNKELKPMFLELGFKTAQDGLFAASAEETYLEVIKGSLTNENAPRYDLLQLDPTTSLAIFTRLMYRTFSTRLDKRLQANTSYLIVIRLSVGRDDRQVKARVKDVYRFNGKAMKLIDDARDPDRRKMRMCGQFLGGAFTEIPDVNELKLLQADLDARNAEVEDAGDEE